MDQPTKELKNTTYELFVVALSSLSIINLVIVTFTADPAIGNIATVMDIVLSVIFLIDFGYRLLSAESKRTYFVTQYGWADLLASIPAPQFKLLRLFRIWRAGRLMRAYGARRLLQQFLHDRASSALLTVLFLIIVVLEFGGMGVLAAERRSPDANIKGASDALWWAYVSITTVGYGDRYPVTNAGRLWGVVVLTMGVGLFGVLTGFLANSFLSPQSQADEVASVRTAVDPALRDPPVSLDEIKQILAEQRQVQSDIQERLGEHRQMQADVQERLAAIERMLVAASLVGEHKPEQLGGEHASSASTTMP